MDETRFRKCSVAERLGHVEADGTYLGSRFHGRHQVHLYGMEGFYCEVWMRAGLHYVEWIEVARNTDILSEYVKVDLKGLLG